MTSSKNTVLKSRTYIFAIFNGDENGHCHMPPKSAPDRVPVNDDGFGVYAKAKTMKTGKINGSFRLLPPIG